MSTSATTTCAGRSQALRMVRPASRIAVATPPLDKATDCTTPVVWPSAEVTVLPMAFSAWDSAVVVSSDVKVALLCTACSTFEKVAIWLTNWVGSEGFDGSWFLSSCTRSWRNSV